MKPKDFNQKLTLNKRTIADLNNGEMDNLRGGGPFTDDDYTCFYITCLCETSPFKCCTGNPCKSIED